MLPWKKLNSRKYVPVDRKRRRTWRRSGRPQRKSRERRLRRRRRIERGKKRWRGRKHSLISMQVRKLDQKELTSTINVSVPQRYVEPDGRNKISRLFWGEWGVVGTCYSPTHSVEIWGLILILGLFMPRK